MHQMANVDWEQGRLTVPRPNTEPDPGHEQRVVPTMQKLLMLLQDRFDVWSDVIHFVATAGKSLPKSSTVQETRRRGESNTVSPCFVSPDLTTT